MTVRTQEKRPPGKPGLQSARRLIVKVGSALLVDDATGQIHRRWLEALADDIAALRRRGQQVVIVSSGAIAVGRRHLGLVGRRLKLAEKQAAAATGQGRLAHAYQEVLSRHGVTAAQVLLTIDDTENRRRYINARNTVDTLLQLGAVPVINENDTVATQEIRFGDNDRLAARVAQMISADTLVLLSDIDGLYSADPSQNPDAEFIHEVKDLGPEIEAMAGDSRSDYGSGGMVTKLMAARICMGAGCRMLITAGHPLHPLQTFEETGRGTWFLAAESPRAARKHWIASSLTPQGAVMVDDGALAALKRGKSLLPAGVTAVEGAFQRGDAVLIRDNAGREVARGLVAYSAEEARKIIGHKSGEIVDRLGYRGRDEIVHRDDLALTA